MTIKNKKPAEVDSMKLVAPGTSGSMAEVDLTGTPEVAVRVNYSAELTLSDNWTGNDGATFYCPFNFGTILQKYPIIKVLFQNFIVDYGQQNDYNRYGHYKDYINKTCNTFKGYFR